MRGIVEKKLHTNMSRIRIFVTFIRSPEENMQQMEL